MLTCTLSTCKILHIQIKYNQKYRNRQEKSMMRTKKCCLLLYGVGIEPLMETFPRKVGHIPHYGYKNWASTCSTIGLTMKWKKEKKR